MPTCQGKPLVPNCPCQPLSKCKCNADGWGCVENPPSADASAVGKCPSKWVCNGAILGYCLAGALLLIIVLMLIFKKRN